MTAGPETTTDYYLPFYVAKPGEPDTLLFVIGALLIVVFVTVGVLYFKLHSIPEKLAHKGENKTQFQIVAVLALLALFTHNNAFWVAALLLAMIRIPDITTPLLAIADGIVGLGRRRGITAEPAVAVLSAEPVPAAEPLLAAASDLPVTSETDTGHVNSSQPSATPPSPSLVTDAGRQSSGTS